MGTRVSGEERTFSDRFAEKLLAAVVAVVGHGLFLAYKYVRHGRVSTAGLIVLAFMAAVTALGALYFMHLRRQERRDTATWRLHGDGPEP